MTDITILFLAAISLALIILGLIGVPMALLVATITRRMKSRGDR